MPYVPVLHAIGAAVAVIAAITGPAKATDYNCVPLEVAVLDNRVHVQCAAPAPKCRGSYPTDTGNPVIYFAVSTSDDPEWVNRFIQIADVAITSGMPIRFSFTSGDFSGEGFDCSRKDCRHPFSFALERTTTVPVWSSATPSPKDCPIR